ncbi:MAG TPA: Hint domain-containing protein, partial [Pirellulales bacterium]|nr:Hint domain-containing protein [Pirellulales bacterium]
AIFDPTPISDILETIYFGATGNWKEMAISFGFAVVGTLGTVVGGQQATNAVRAGRLANSLDAANDLRRLGRAGDTIGDVRSLYKAADPVDNVASSLKGPAKGYCPTPNGFCFVAGTLVWMGGGQATTAGAIDVIPVAPEEQGLQDWLTVVLAGIGIAVSQTANYRLRKKQDEDAERDSLFAQWYADDDDGGRPRGAGFQLGKAGWGNSRCVRPLDLDPLSHAAILEAASDPLDDADAWIATDTSERRAPPCAVLDTRPATCHRKPLEAQTLSATTLKAITSARRRAGRGRPQSRVGLVLLALFVGLAALPYFGIFRRLPSTAHRGTLATSADNRQHSARWSRTKRIEEVIVTDHVAKQPPVSPTDGGSFGLVVNETEDRAEERASNDRVHDGWYTIPPDDVLANGLSFKLAHGRITEISGDDDHHLLGTRYVPGDLDGTDVTRALWRSVDLALTKPDGSRAKLSVGRPLWWLQATQAELGGAIDLAMHEVGVQGAATVTRIGPCNADSRELDSESALVTGTIAHKNAIVWDLVFNGDTAAPLGVTANHPIFSKDRTDWVPAGDLLVNEQVVTAEGTAWLTAKTRRAGRHNVYNIEVHRAHAYYVSQFGVLAHNTGIPCDGNLYDVGLAKDLRKNPLSGTEVHHVPQSREAELLIGDFNRVNNVGNEATIRLPWSEHQAVNEAQRARGSMASARDLLADEIRILRNNTNASNAKLKELIELNKQLHRFDYLSLQR